MESNLEVKVRYHKAWGVTLLVMAILNLVLGALIMKALTMVMGAFFVLIALGFLTRPYFVLREGAVELKNMLGMTVRTYVFDGTGDFEVEDGGKRIFLTDAHGLRKRVRVSRYMSDRGDWERFMVAIGTRAFD